MKLVLLIILLMSSVLNAFGANTHGHRSQHREMQNWFGDALSGYIVSGCNPATSAGLIVSAFSCDAYVKDGSELIFVRQGNFFFSVPDSPDVWLGVRRDQSLCPGGWTCVPGTHYMYQASATKPPPPVGSLVISHLEIVSSAISKTTRSAPTVGLTMERIRGRLNVLDFGAVPNDGVDDAPAFQEAFDYAISISVGGVGIPDVWVPPGQYHFESTIQWRSAGIICSGNSIGTYLIWNGAADQVFFNRTADSGGAATAEIRNCRIQAGSSRPSIFLDFTNGGSANIGLVINNLTLIGSSSHGIALGTGYVAVTISKILASDIEGFVFHFDTGTNQAAVAITDFAYDNGVGATPSGQGIVRFLNSTGSSSMGTALLANWHIEKHREWTPPAAMVSVSLPGPTFNARSIPIIMQNISFQDIGLTDPNDCVFSRDTTDTNGSEAFSMFQVRFEGMNNFLCGTWPASFPLPPIQDYYEMFALQGLAQRVGQTLEIIAIIGTPPVTVKQGTQAFDRLRIDHNGTLHWGSGTSATDIQLLRWQPNVLALATDDFLKFGELPFASLPALPNGTMVYCSDCTRTTPCAAAGSGAIAKRINGTWVCD